MSQIKGVPLNQIALNGGTQFRDQINRDVVREYKQAMLEEGAFPPVQCVFDGTVYWLWDGFHRLNAFKSIGIDVIDVEWRNGTQEDAQDLALSANSRHGQALNAASKQKKVAAALAMPRHANKSDREIAKLCGVSHTMVAVLRRPERKAARNETMLKAARKIVGDADFRIASGVGHHSELADEKPDPNVDYGPDEDELRANEMAQEEDRIAMQKFLEANDKLAHLEAENKRLRHLLPALELRLKNMMEEKNEAIRFGKSYQTKYYKLVKILYPNGR